MQRTLSKDCQTSITLPVYHSESHGVYLLQLRSGVAKGRSAEFLEALVSWSKASGFAQVVVMASSAAEERIDSQLAGTQLRYVSSAEDKELR